MIKMNKYSLSIRAISLSLILTFLGEQVLFANPDLKPLSQDLFKQEKLKLGFQISESMATIEDSWKGTSGSKTVYLIQDAHTNNSGQLNEAKALDTILQNEKDLRFIFSEAGAGDSSLSFLRQYQTRNKREAIARSYLNRGLLHGAEYLDLTSDRDFTLWGVEDPELYVQSVQAYGFVAQKRDKLEDYLKKIEQTTKTIKERLYNPLLLSFDKTYQKYQTQELSLTDYFEDLTSQARALEIPLEFYPHLRLLKNLRLLESKIDFKKATEEEKEAIDSLSTADREELSALSKDANKSPFKLSNKDNKPEKGFYALLEERLGENKNYPELYKYFDYLKKAQQINLQSVLKEQKGLEKEVFNKLCANQDEMALVSVSKNLELLKKLLNLTLTPGEFKEYQEDKSSFDIKRITGFLNKKIMDLKKDYERAVFLESGYEDVIQKCEEFYTLTYDRDQKFLQNMIQKMDEAKQTKSILITGGYHAPNLKYLLKEKGISYVVITPQILHETNIKRYEKILLSQDLAKAKSMIAKTAVSQIAPGMIMAWLINSPIPMATQEERQIIPDISGQDFISSPPLSGARMSAAKPIGMTGVSGATDSDWHHVRAVMNRARHSRGKETEHAEIQAVGDELRISLNGSQATLNLLKPRFIQRIQIEWNELSYILWNRYLYQDIFSVYDAVTAAVIWWILADFEFISKETPDGLGLIAKEVLTNAAKHSGSMIARAALTALLIRAVNVFKWDERYKVQSVTSETANPWASSRFQLYVHYDLDKNLNGPFADLLGDFGRYIADQLPGYKFIGATGFQWGKRATLSFVRTSPSGARAARDQTSVTKVPGVSHAQLRRRNLESYLFYLRSYGQRTEFNQAIGLLTAVIYQTPISLRLLPEDVGGESYRELLRLSDDFTYQKAKEMIQAASLSKKMEDSFISVLNGLAYALETGADVTSEADLFVRTRRELEKAGPNILHFIWQGRETELIIRPYAIQHGIPMEAVGQDIAASVVDDMLMLFKIFPKKPGALVTFDVLSLQLKKEHAASYLTDPKILARAIQCLERQGFPVRREGNAQYSSGLATASIANLLSSPEWKKLKGDESPLAISRRIQMILERFPISYERIAKITNRVPHTVIQELSRWRTGYSSNGHRIREPENYSIQNWGQVLGFENILLKTGSTRSELEEKLLKWFEADRHIPAGKRLQELMRIAGKSAPELAASVGVFPGKVHKWIRGYKIVDKFWKKIADALDVDPLILIVGLAKDKAMIYLETLGERIKALRLSLGLTRNRLAQEMGVGKTQVRNWEEEGAMPLPERQTKLSRLFDVAEDKLFSSDAEPPLWEATGVRMARHESAAGARIASPAPFLRGLVRSALPIIYAATSGVLSIVGLDQRFESVIKGFKDYYDEFPNAIRLFIQHENGEDLIHAAREMVYDNTVVDFTLTSWVLKPGFAVLVSYFSGNVVLGFVVYVGQFFISPVGGSVRLLVMRSRAKEWPDLPRWQNPRALFLNYISYLGNLSPILFIPLGLSLSDVRMVRKVIPLSLVIKLKVSSYSNAALETKEFMIRNSSKMAKAVLETQRKFEPGEYGFPKFKIVAVEGYPVESVVRRICGKEVVETWGSFLQLIGLKILSFVGLRFGKPYRGERPVLLFGTADELSEMKRELSDQPLSGPEKARVYQVDIDELSGNQMNLFQNFDTGQYIRPMFPEGRPLNGDGAATSVENGAGARMAKSRLAKELIPVEVINVTMNGRARRLLLLKVIGAKEPMKRVFSRLPKSGVPVVDEDRHIGLWDFLFKEYASTFILRDESTKRIVAYFQISVPKDQTLARRAISVDPRYQRLGIATQLNEWLVRYAKERNMKRITAVTDPGAGRLNGADQMLLKFGYMPWALLFDDIFEMVRPNQELARLLSGTPTKPELYNFLAAYPGASILYGLSLDEERSSAGARAAVSNLIKRFAVQVRVGEIQPIAEAEANKITGVLNELEKLTADLDPSRGLKIKKRLSQAAGSAQALKPAIGAKWGQILALLQDTERSKRIFSTEQIPSLSIALGNRGLIVRHEALAAGFNGEPLILLLCLAKEGYMLYLNSNEQTKKLPPLEKEARSVLAAFGVYAALPKDRREWIDSWASQHKDVSQYLSLYRLFFDGVSQSASFDAMTAARERIETVYPGIQDDTPMELAPDDLRAVSLEPGDLLGITDPAFLHSTDQNPAQVQSGSGQVVWMREVAAAGKSVRAVFDISEISDAERELMRVGFASLGESGSVVLRELPDKRWGRKYKLEYTKELFRSKVFTAYLWQWLETLKSLPEISRRPELAGPFEKLKSVILGRPVLDNGEFLVTQEAAEADDARNRAIATAYETDRLARAAEEKERQLYPFKLENARILIHPVSENPEEIERARSLEQAFLAIGFKHVKIQPYLTPYWEEGNEAEIHVITDTKLEPLGPRIYSTDPEPKTLGHRITRIDRSSRVFEFSADGKYLATHEPNVSYGYGRGPRKMPVATPAMAAEFIGRQTIRELAEKGGPLLAGNEALLRLPELESRSQTVETGEAETSWKEEMTKRLRDTETYLTVQGESARKSALSSRLLFARRPINGHIGDQRCLIFEDTQTEGNLRLKPDDEITIHSTDGKYEWRAVVLDADEDRLITSLPFGPREQGSAIPSEGIIRVSPRSITTEVQLAFLRRIMSHPESGRYPLVDVALGFAPLGHKRRDVDWVVLSDPDIRKNPEQVKLLASALNGYPIELSQGPPGTGKTTVAAEVAYQNHVLGHSQIVAAQTNRAVDNVLLKLKAKGVKVYRIGNHPQVFDPGLRQDWIYAGRPRKPVQPKEKDPDALAKFAQTMRDYEKAYGVWRQGIIDDIKFGRVVVGGTVIGVEVDRFLNREMREERGQPFQFNDGIIEEASVASFSEILLVLGKIREKVLIIGDQKQLGLSPIDEELQIELHRAGLEEDEIKACGKSFFNFLLQRNIFNMTMLKGVYRMTPLLVQLTNYFYEGKLRAMRQDVPKDVNRASLIIIDTHRLGFEEKTSASAFNPVEADIVLGLMRQLSQAGIDTGDIGLLTPYGAQVSHYRARLKEAVRQRRLPSRETAEEMAKLMNNVGTAWPFQGREKPVMVVSPVRRDPPQVMGSGRVIAKTGFVGPEMWNVITSRGQEADLIVLNSDTFLASRNSTVAGFVRHMLGLAKSQGIYIELSPENRLPDLQIQAQRLGLWIKEVKSRKAMPASAGARVAELSWDNIAALIEKQKRLYPLRDEIERRFIEHYSVKQRIDWSYKGHSVEADIRYDSTRGCLIVEPTDETKRLYPKLSILSLEPIKKGVAPRDTFGMIYVRFGIQDDQVITLFDEVQSSLGYRNLRPKKIRNIFRPWMENAIQNMMGTLRFMGIHSFYASTPEGVNQRYAELQGSTLSNINLWEHYIFPFKNKGWKEARIGMDEQTDIPVWHWQGARMASVSGVDQAKIDHALSTVSMAIDRLDNMEVVKTARSLAYAKTEDAYRAAVKPLDQYPYLGDQLRLAFEGLIRQPTLANVIQLLRLAGSADEFNGRIDRRLDELKPRLNERLLGAFDSGSIDMALRQMELGNFDVSERLLDRVRENLQVRGQDSLKIANILGQNYTVTEVWKLMVEKAREYLEIAHDRAWHVKSSKVNSPFTAYLQLIATPLVALGSMGVDRHDAKNLDVTVLWAVEAIQQFLSRLNQEANQLRPMSEHVFNEMANLIRGMEPSLSVLDNRDLQKHAFAPKSEEILTYRVSRLMALGQLRIFTDRLDAVTAELDRISQMNLKTKAEQSRPDDQTSRGNDLKQRKKGNEPKRRILGASPTRTDYIDHGAAKFSVLRILDGSFRDMTVGIKSVEVTIQAVSGAEAAPEAPVAITIIRPVEEDTAMTQLLVSKVIARTPPRMTGTIQDFIAQELDYRPAPIQEMNLADLALPEEEAQKLLIDLLERSYGRHQRTPYMEEIPVEDAGRIDERDQNALLSYFKKPFVFPAQTALMSPYLSTTAVTGVVAKNFGLNLSQQIALQAALLRDLDRPSTVSQWTLEREQIIEQAAPGVQPGFDAHLVDQSLWIARQLLGVSHEKTQLTGPAGTGARAANEGRRLRVDGGGEELTSTVDHQPSASRSVGARMADANGPKSPGFLREWLEKCKAILNNLQRLWRLIFDPSNLVLEDLGRYGISFADSTLNFSKVPFNVSWVNDDARPKKEGIPETDVEKIPEIRLVYPINFLPVLHSTYHSILYIGLAIIHGTEQPVVIKIFRSRLSKSDTYAELVDAQLGDLDGTNPEFLGKITTSTGKLRGYAMRLIIGNSIDLSNMPTLDSFDFYEHNPGIRKIINQLEAIGVHPGREFIKTRTGGFFNVDVGNWRTLDERLYRARIVGESAGARMADRTDRRERLSVLDFFEESFGHPHTKQGLISNALFGRDTFQTDNLGLRQSHRNEFLPWLRKLEFGGGEFTQVFGRILFVPELSFFFIGLELGKFGFMWFIHRSPALLPPSIYVYTKDVNFYSGARAAWPENTHFRDADHAARTVEMMRDEIAAAITQGYVDDIDGVKSVLQPFLLPIEWALNGVPESLFNYPGVNGDIWRNMSIYRLPLRYHAISEVINGLVALAWLALLAPDMAREQISHLTVLLDQSRLSARLPAGRYGAAAIDRVSLLRELGILRGILTQYSALLARERVNDITIRPWLAGLNDLMGKTIWNNSIVSQDEELLTSVDADVFDPYVKLIQWITRQEDVQKGDKVPQSARNLVQDTRPIVTRIKELFDSTVNIRSGARMALGSSRNSQRRISRRLNGGVGKERPLSSNNSLKVDELLREAYVLSLNAPKAPTIQERIDLLLSAQNLLDEAQNKKGPHDRTYHYYIELRLALNFLELGAAYEEKGDAGQAETSYKKVEIVLPGNSITKVRALIRLGGIYLGFAENAGRDRADQLEQLRLAELYYRKASSVIFHLVDDRSRVPLEERAREIKRWFGSELTTIETQKIIVADRISELSGSRPDSATEAKLMVNKGGARAAGNRTRLTRIEQAQKSALMEAAEYFGIHAREFNALYRASGDHLKGLLRVVSEMESRMVLHSNGQWQNISKGLLERTAAIVDITNQMDFNRLYGRSGRERILPEQGIKNVIGAIKRRLFLRLASLENLMSKVAKQLKKEAGRNPVPRLTVEGDTALSLDSRAAGALEEILPGIIAFASGGGAFGSPDVRVEIKIQGHTRPKFLMQIHGPARLDWQRLEEAVGSLAGDNRLLRHEASDELLIKDLAGSVPDENYASVKESDIRRMSAPQKRSILPFVTGLVIFADGSVKIAPGEFGFGNARRFLAGVGGSLDFRSGEEGSDFQMMIPLNPGAGSNPTPAHEGGARLPAGRHGAAETELSDNKVPTGQDAADSTNVRGRFVIDQIAGFFDALPRDGSGTVFSISETPQKIFSPHRGYRREIKKVGEGVHKGKHETKESTSQVNYTVNPSQVDWHELLGDLTLQMHQFKGQSADEWEALRKKLLRYVHTGKWGEGARLAMRRQGQTLNPKRSLSNAYPAETKPKAGNGVNAGERAVGAADMRSLFVGVGTAYAFELHGTTRALSLEREDHSLTAYDLTVKGRELFVVEESSGARFAFDLKQGNLLTKAEVEHVPTGLSVKNENLTVALNQFLSDNSHGNALSKGLATPYVWTVHLDGYELLSIPRQRIVLSAIITLIDNRLSENTIVLFKGPKGLADRAWEAARGLSKLKHPLAQFRTFLTREEQSLPNVHTVSVDHLEPAMKEASETGGRHLWFAHKAIATERGDFGLLPYSALTTLADLLVSGDYAHARTLLRDLTGHDIRENDLRKLAQGDISLLREHLIKLTSMLEADLVKLSLALRASGGSV